MPTDTEPSKADADHDKGVGKVGYKVMTGVGAAVGTTVARKVLAKGWTRATGKVPPANPEHPDVRWTEAASWAALSAAAVALVRLAAQRRAATTWRRASGTLPPGLDNRDT